MAYTFVPPEGVSLQEMTPFTKLLPYEKVFNEADVMNLAYQQLFPDIYRERAAALGNLGRSMALSGAYRTGRAATTNRDMMNEYLRKLNEQKSEFAGTLNDLANQWYLQEWYNYSTSPSTYTRPKKLPTYEEYATEAGYEPQATPIEEETGTYLGSNIGSAMRNIGLLSQAYNPYNPMTQTNPLASKTTDIKRSLLPVFPESTDTTKTGTASLSNIYSGLPTGTSVFRTF